MWILSNERDFILHMGHATRQKINRIGGKNRKTMVLKFAFILYARILFHYCPLLFYFEIYTN